MAMSIISAFKIYISSTKNDYSYIGDIYNYGLYFVKEKSLLIEFVERVKVHFVLIKRSIQI